MGGLGPELLIYVFRANTLTILPKDPRNFISLLSY